MEVNDPVKKFLLQLFENLSCMTHSRGWVGFYPILLHSLACRGDDNKVKGVACEPAYYIRRVLINPVICSNY